MTDEEEKEIDAEDETAASAEPDFSPAAAAPSHDDDSTEDDPHASFDVATPVEEDPYHDLYGVGAPKTHHNDYEDDEEEEGEGFESADSEAY